MPFRFEPREHLMLLGYALRWLVLAAPVAVATGSAVALFLRLLDAATHLRFQHPWLMALLPLAGVAIVLVYHHYGRDSGEGNNLVMDRIHEPGGGIPRRMAPLVLGATVVTHLFGGSAGREGTAVQMGGSIAQALARPLRLGQHDTRILLMCGVAAGFGAVFGTPLTGAIFALEVLALGRMQYDALLPCLLASLMGDLTCATWGIPHTHYHVPAGLAGPGPEAAAGAWARIEPMLALKVAVAGVAFGLAAMMFAELCHSVGATARRYISRLWLRPVLGALLVLGLAAQLGTTDYLGLGVTTADGSGVSIVNAFHEGGAAPLSWLWKSIFTALTLGTGFKGGEVTPLFFVGATLGNALAGLLAVPVPLMAAVGFIAVFAGATNTPLACTIMGVELFGAEYLPYFAIACFVAYLASGHSGIYLSQRVGAGKLGGTMGAAGSLNSGASTHETLRSIRSRRRSSR